MDHLDQTDKLVQTDPQDHLVNQVSTDHQVNLELMERLDHRVIADHPAHATIVRHHVPPRVIKREILFIVLIDRDCLLKFLQLMKMGFILLRICPRKVLTAKHNLII
ncbi:unnamed protein product [Enterobius vermicularis]|uniref:Uncharacterized protein n=1 Tax=Enterobius vermicularis TaxID=51028 RepID=A0A0N4VPX5_ENTVE|nr:unnamed protein product [Enterobius vermicularis]